MTSNAGPLKNLVMARSPIDRASHLRMDDGALERLWAEARILILVEDRLHASDTALNFQSAKEITGTGERFFLGQNVETRESYFAWHTSEMLVPENDLRTLRQVGASLSDLEAGLAVHAVGLAHWHAAHPRCSRCGAATQSTFGGAVRICVEDESQHHPRTDPAVIVLVKDREDRLLLGHQPTWPEKRFSNFAGFVEPGESFEQCVVREVAEECGVIVGEVHYLGSQPWPFPASIMIAFEAVTEDASTAKADGEEITEIRWFSRSEMKSAVETGEILLPPRISVSRRMIEHWYGVGAREDLTKGDDW
ncbi:MAG: NAD(+) diphosphatase [Actinobacteria bacterium]|nr:NAD(+) diphosphatase [Actinomycetota bacterium]